jgi:hypothetical protein
MIWLLSWPPCGSWGSPTAFWTSLRDNLHSRCGGMAPIRPVSEVAHSKCRIRAPQLTSLWARHFCWAVIALCLVVIIILIILRYDENFSRRNRPLSVKQEKIFLCLSFCVLKTLFSQIKEKVKRFRLTRKSSLASFLKLLELTYP